MKNILILIAFMVSFNAYAIDLFEGETATITCGGVTEYENNDPIRVDDVITYKIYKDGVFVETQPDCSFSIPVQPIGSYVYHATANSAYYNSESAPSNTDTVNVVVNLRPKSVTITVTKD